MPAHAIASPMPRIMRGLPCCRGAPTLVQMTVDTAQVTSRVLQSAVPCAKSCDAGRHVSAMVRLKTCKRHAVSLEPRAMRSTSGLIAIDPCPLRRLRRTCAGDSQSPMCVGTGHRYSRLHAPWGQYGCRRQRILEQMADPAPTRRLSEATDAACCTTCTMDSRVLCPG